MAPISDSTIIVENETIYAIESTEYTTDQMLSASTNSLEEGRKGIELSRIVICSVLFTIVLATIFGNALVLIAFGTQKKLRNSNFMLYIANLAVTDLAVAMTAMSFFTIDILLGYWPFGKVLCGIWVFFDYGMTFASVFTLVAISLDRFWSVTWSLHYRNHNSKNKTLMAIGVIWLLVLVAWLGPCIDDRLKESDPYVCIVDPANNRGFVIFYAIFGHHTPFAIMFFCYIWVSRKMWLMRSRIKPLKGMTAALATRTTEHTDIDGKSTNTRDPTGDTNTKGESVSKAAVSSANREKKIFITLSYVILSYILCWVPFHLVYDVNAVIPGKVPDGIYILTFWMTYFNSTLNPLLYAFSAAEFRSAFRNVMKCKWDMPRV